jgi:hypothetical protein
MSDKLRWLARHDETVLGKNLVALSPNRNLRGLWFTVVVIIRRLPTACAARTSVNNARG